MLNYYEQRGGLRVGKIVFKSAGWPLAKIKVYRDRIILSAIFWSDMEFKKKNILRIKETSIIPSILPIIQIFAKNDDRIIQFQPLDIKQLIGKLKKFGYTVR